MRFMEGFMLHILSVILFIQPDYPYNYRTGRKETIVQERLSSQSASIKITK